MSKRKCGCHPEEGITCQKHWHKMYTKTVTAEEMFSPKGKEDYMCIFNRSQLGPYGKQIYTQIFERANKDHFVYMTSSPLKVVRGTMYTLTWSADSQFMTPSGAYIYTITRAKVVK